MPKQVVLEFPVDLPEKGLQKKELLKRAKALIILELLQTGEISQGKATELLEISRQDLFDLMAKYEIPVADFPPKELEQQRKEAKNKSWGKQP